MKRVGPGACLGTGAALALLVLLALGTGASALADPAAGNGLQPIPALAARVTDLTGTLSAAQQSELEQKLAAFEAAKGSQLAVLIVASTAPEDIAQYSIRVFDQWKLGRKNVDDGALLLIAKNDRRMRIEPARGLEGALPDAICNRIIDQTLAPAFRMGNFYGGIDAALDQMMKLIQGEPLPPAREQWQPHRQAHGSLLPGLLFGVFAASVVLRAMFGRTVGSTLTGVGAGLLVWITGYAVLFAGLAALAAFFFTLLGGLSRGSGWSSYGGGWGGFGGGGFGGGGFGGGGGFSGGGGVSAGGGASGSW
jgi:uncharacterized protein